MKKIIRSLLSFICSLPILLSAEKPLSSSINDFGIRFYQNSLSNSSQNELFSPYCLFNGFSMAYLGAQGKTAEEMTQVLSLETSQEEVSSHLGLLAHLLSPQEGFELNVANSLWTDPSFSLLPGYQELVEGDLKASVRALNFKSPQKASAIMNQWISEKTQGTINELLKPQDLSSETRLMLISALYFKGSFMHPFKETQTTPQSFYPSDAAVKKVSMMHQVEQLPYYETEEFQLALMPFKGKNQAEGKLAAFVLLPKRSLEEVESSLSAENILMWTQNCKLEQLSLSVPKFQTKVRYDLSKILPSLGTVEAFSKRADFSGISDREALCIDKALHETIFSFDENGVCAASATVIEFITRCSRFNDSKAIDFTANHPFLFGIVDLKSNVMLFLGKMIDP
jgi:serpin B